MKRPTDQNFKPLRTLGVGETAYFCGSSVGKPCDVKILDVFESYANFGGGLGYLVLVDNKPTWLSCQYLWPLDQISNIEKMAGAV